MTRTAIIKNILNDNPVLLAPMAGVTDMPFRGICKIMGCGLTTTEMVSAKGLHYNAEQSKELLRTHPLERPCAIQIFGSDPAIMAQQAAKLCEDYAGEIAVIDINMGCPAPKITSNGEGSALMKTPELASKVIRAVAGAASLPVTVKFRKGWDDDSINAVEFAQMAQESGAAAVTVHGRTRMQFYSGKADWAIIAAVKEAVTIPVIGNGDLFTAEDALAMMKQTNCDGVMVARGAQGNPWLFTQIAYLRETGESLPPPSPSERVETALEHARQMVELKGDHAIVEMRKHVAWYISGMRGAAAVRCAANGCTSYDALCDLLMAFAVQQESLK